METSNDFWEKKKSKRSPSLEQRAVTCFALLAILRSCIHLTFSDLAPFFSHHRHKCLDGFKGHAEGKWWLLWATLAVFSIKRWQTCAVMHSLLWLGDPDALSSPGKWLQSPRYTLLCFCSNAHTSREVYSVEKNNISEKVWVACQRAHSSESLPSWDHDYGLWVEAGFSLKSWRFCIVSQVAEVRKGGEKSDDAAAGRWEATLIILSGAVLYSSKDLPNQTGTRFDCKLPKKKRKKTLKWYVQFCLVTQSCRVHRPPEVPRNLTLQTYFPFIFKGWRFTWCRNLQGPSWSSWCSEKFYFSASTMQTLFMCNRDLDFCVLV